MARKDDGIEIPSFLIRNDNAKKKKKSTLESSRNYRKEPKKRTKVILGFIFFIILVIALLISPIFNVYNITVKNNNRFTQENITNRVLGILQNNMFRIKLSDYKQKLEEDPYIESVTIKRKLPDTVEIYINERQAWLQIEFVGAYVYIDKKGYILEKAAEKGDFQTISGLSTDVNNYVPGNRLIESDLIKLDVVNQIMEKSKDYGILDVINNINVADDENYVLTVENGDKLIYIGNGSELVQKIREIEAILRNSQGIKGKIYLDKNLDGKMDAKPIFELEV